MPALRVYATDSFDCPVTATSDGYTATWILEEEKARRAVSIQADAQYYFIYSWKRPIPGVASASACRMRFDFNTVPQLQGARVLSVRGPFVFLREKTARLTVEGHPSVNQWFDLRQPFIGLFTYYPTDPQEYNVLGRAALSSYFDTHGGRNDTILELRDGVQTCDMVVGAISQPPYEGYIYNGQVTAKIDSHIGVNPPYLIVEYEAAPIEVVGCAPQYGFVNEKTANRFSWAVAPVKEDTIGSVSQASATFQWRARGSDASVALPVAGNRTYIDIPAGVWPNGAVQWRVQAVSQRGAESPFSPWFELTTADWPPSAPTLLSPDGGVRDGAKKIAFSWQHHSPLSTPPSAFEIEVDYEDGAGYIPLSGRVTSAASSYSAPENALRGGVVKWRVRDFNTDGGASPWSAAARFTVRAAPDPPRIRSVEKGVPRPEVAWAAEDQQAFELWVGRGGEEVFASGLRFGQQTSFQIPCFLTDGRYRLRLRVQNAFGMASVWAETDFTVSCRRRMAVRLAGRPVADGVRLEWETEVTG